MNFQEKLLDYLKEQLHMTRNAGDPWITAMSDYDHENNGKCEVYEEIIDWIESEMKDNSK